LLMQVFFQLYSPAASDIAVAVILLRSVILLRKVYFGEYNITF
jgi:hypothetical protein